jgi:hypothetical protein
MDKDHVQMTPDHRRLLGRDLVRAPQFKKSLKPETEIPALHLRASSLP